MVAFALQAQWAATQTAGADYLGSKRSLVLRIVAATAAHSGPEEARQLTDDLLKVGNASITTIFLIAVCEPKSSRHSVLLENSRSVWRLMHSMFFLQQALQTFDLPMEAVVTHMRAVAQLAAISGEGAAWQQALMSGAERVLSAYVGRADVDAVMPTDANTPGLNGTAAAGAGGAVVASEGQAATAVFTVGEAAVLCGTKAPGSLVMLVQALTAPRLMPPAGNARDVDAAVAAGTPVPGPLQVCCSHCCTLVALFEAAHVD